MLSSLIDTCCISFVQLNDEISKLEIKDSPEKYDLKDYGHQSGVKATESNSIVIEDSDSDSDIESNVTSYHIER